MNKISELKPDEKHPTDRIHTWKRGLHDLTVRSQIKRTETTLCSH